MVYSVNHSHATEKPRGENSSRGLVCLVKSNAPQQLLLEYYACSCTIFYIVEWGDFEAEVFSYETNWYIGTIARKNWCSIHGLFFTIQSVGVFADGHNDFGVAYSVGYALSFLIPVNFSAKCFAEYAEWNHGSPSIVYIRSSVAFNDFVVDEVIGRTDGHNNITASVFIFITEGVGEGICIEFAVLSRNNYADINSTSLVAFEVHGSLTILNLWNNLKIYGSFFIALTYDRCGEFTIYLRNITISIYYRNVNSVSFANNAFGRIDGNSFSEVVLNNSQFFFSKTDSTEGWIIYLNGNGGTNEIIVGCFVQCSSKVDSIRCDDTVINSITIDTNLELSVVRNVNFQAVFVNILRLYIYFLTKSNGIVNSTDSVVLSTQIIAIGSIHIKNEFLSGAKFNSGEVNSHSLFAAIVQGNTYRVVTRNEIFSSASVFQSVNASFIIPSEIEVVSIYSVFAILLRLSFYFKTVSMFARRQSGITICSSFVSEHATAYSVTAISIGDSKLNSIAQHCIFHSGTIIFIGTSEHFAAVFNLSDLHSVNIALGNDQGSFCIIVGFTKGYFVLTSIGQSELEGKFTLSVGGNSAIISKALKVHAFVCADIDLFVFSSSAIFSRSFTSYSVNLGIARGYFVIDTNFVGISTSRYNALLVHIGDTVNNNAGGFNFRSSNIDSDVL